MKYEQSKWYKESKTLRAVSLGKKKWDLQTIVPTNKQERKEDTNEQNQKWAVKDYHRHQSNSEYYEGISKNLYSIKLYNIKEMNNFSDLDKQPKLIQE